MLFEGFLEALCRLSGLKALPTDEEITKAGCSHAGSYMAKLRIEDEETYEKIMEERSTPWSERFTPPQPMARLVEHTICMIIYKIEAETSGSDNLSGAEQTPCSCGRTNRHKSASQPKRELDSAPGTADGNCGPRNRLTAF